MCGSSLMDNQKPMKMAGDITSANLKNHHKEYRTFSNNPLHSCKIFCGFCDKVINLSGLGKHVNNIHKSTVKEYKSLFGDPRKQIIKLVFHKCAICQKVLLFNTDDISKHLKKSHQVAYKEYIKEHMVESNDSQQTQSIGEKKNLVTIKCYICSKTFKQNVQLKMHMKRHSSS